MNEKKEHEQQQQRQRQQWRKDTRDTTIQYIAATFRNRLCVYCCYNINDIAFLLWLGEYSFALLLYFLFFFLRFVVGLSVDCFFFRHIVSFHTSYSACVVHKIWSGYPIQFICIQAFQHTLRGLQLSGGWSSAHLRSSKICGLKILQRIFVRNLSPLESVYCI